MFVVASANFLGAFIRRILKTMPAMPLRRNFPVPDCGVADLLLCQVPIGIVQDVETCHVRLTAFEMKLSDWRKALQQAYRYKYYADLSVVVLPEKAAVRAIQSIRLFKALGVDLWTMNAVTGGIHKHVAHEAGPARSIPQSDPTRYRGSPPVSSISACRAKRRNPS